MSSRPFQEAAKSVARRYNHDYARMQVESQSARSHAWWRNLTQHGAWRGPGATRVGPPTPEAIPGIAALFGTTEEQVSAMIAADWYGVEQGNGMSPAVQKIGGALEALNDADLDLIEAIVARLRPPPRKLKKIRRTTARA